MILLVDVALFLSNDLLFNEFVATLVNRPALAVYPPADWPVRLQRALLDVSVYSDYFQYLCLQRSMGRLGG